MQLTSPGVGGWGRMKKAGVGMTARLGGSLPLSSGRIRFAIQIHCILCKILLVYMMMKMDVFVMIMYGGDSEVTII